MEEGKDECRCGRFIELMVEIFSFFVKCEKHEILTKLILSAYYVPGLLSTGVAKGMKGSLCP